MSILDTKTKQKHWFNRNYLYIGTILLIAINILLYKFCGNTWETFAGDVNIQWTDFANFSNIFRSFLDNYSHSGWTHVIGNMICLAVVGIYLERKLGSVNFLLLVVAMSFISAMFVTGSDLNIDHHGFSGVNYCLYAYVLLDYIFYLRPNKRDNPNIILGALTLSVIYVAMCCGDFETFTFLTWPIDLLTNEGHYTSYFCGLILGLIVQLTMFLNDYNNVDAYGTPTLSKKTKAIYLIISVIFISFICTVPAYSAWRYNNLECSITIDCSVDKYDTVLIYNYGELSKQSTFSDEIICSKWKTRVGLNDDTNAIIVSKYYIDDMGNKFNLLHFSYAQNSLPIAYLKNYQIYYEISLKA